MAVFRRFARQFVLDPSGSGAGDTEAEEGFDDERAQSVMTECSWQSNPGPVVHGTACVRLPRGAQLRRPREESQREEAELPPSTGYSGFDDCAGGGS